MNNVSDTVKKLQGCSNLCFVWRKVVRYEISNGVNQLAKLDSNAIIGVIVSSIATEWERLS